jgi:hypothetical protein
MPSFFSERTAEYALVQLLQASLRQTFSSVTPMYYWKTREGNRTSAHVHGGCVVQVLAMFARRPKVMEGQDLVRGKINGELLEFSRAARKVGIATIAGFPAVKSVFELHANPLVLWLPLDQRSAGYEFIVDLSVPHPQPMDNEDCIVSALSSEEIVQHIQQCSQSLSWDSAMQRMGDLKRLRNGSMGFFSRFGFDSGYKPVYFLLSHDAQIDLRT